MTADQAHTLATTDVVPTLMARHGDAIAQTRKRVEDLEQALRELDKVTEALSERGIIVAADLGAVGNSARNARTAARADADADRFEFPRAS